MRVPFLVVRTRSAAETISLGRRLAELVRPGEVLLLVGELGTGKTTFVQGLAEGLGESRRARSPSFTIVHSYEGGKYPLVHVDLFRCSSANEVLDLGLEELISAPAVAAIEWGERAMSVAGEHFLELEFAWEPEDEDVRTIRFLPSGRWGERMGELGECVRAWAKGP